MCSLGRPAPFERYFGRKYRMEFSWDSREPGGPQIWFQLHKGTENMQKNNPGASLIGATLMGPLLRSERVIDIP